ncbi:MAG TPA: CDGSH iron-sulfur domain-containing protein [Planctomycetota bacterium]|nr:CDGSH iron-sulfur domain-containing protein [Planctomycetota bacterium]
MTTKVTVLPNGPILVAGQFEITGADGKPLTVNGPQVALCRCGQSNKKPFCDGSHRSCAFVDPAPKAP